MPDEALSLTPRVTLRALWRQYLPLSTIDIMMAIGDPLANATMAHLPDARANIAVVGVAKSQTTFFESPIIMLLHASNVLAASPLSRAALRRFSLIAAVCLSSGLFLLTLPTIFNAVSVHFLGLDQSLAQRGREALQILVPWPGMIACRRYYQGILIRYGYTRVVSTASVIRLITMAIILIVGLLLQATGHKLACTALIAGIALETSWVLINARRLDLSSLPGRDSNEHLPKTMRDVLRFYAPLANTMMMVWGGRTLLVGVIARATDGLIALAAWPAAWGVVSVLANATRMIQQVIIRNRKDAEFALLLRFAASVGGAWSLVLLALVLFGDAFIDAFIGYDASLRERIVPVLTVCAATPLLVAVQNALQGLLIADGKTGDVNRATYLNTAVLFTFAFVFVQIGIGGAQSAAIAMMLALLAELGWLFLNCRKFWK